MWQSITNGVYWAMLPLRILAYGLRYAFGHPLLFILIFAVLAALGFLMGWQDEAGFATCMVGTLLIWYSEHTDKPNLAWPAPSPFRPRPEPDY